MAPGKDQLAQDLEPTLREALGSRYEGLSLVARGGMGAVYRARHRMMQTDVAVKVMLPGESTDRFQLEATWLAKVRSPNVVIVHDFEILPNDVPVMVMEWIEGSNLFNLMKQRGGKVPESDAISWMIDVCVGMTATASAGIIHRDLKPSNIMIDGENTARVTDFGLARGPLANANASVSGTALGTPYYMSPEQAERPKSIDTRSDIYSFGATFYHTLTGAPMFDGESAFAVLFKHKTEPVIPPQTRNPEISSKIGDLIERCVAKSPDDRFQSFSEISTILERDISPDDSPWGAFADAQLANHLDTFRANRRKYLDARESFADTYSFSANRVLRISTGDIREQAVDAIVSSDDETLSMSGGVSMAILAKAGGLIREEAKRLVPVRQGRAVVTSAGNLPQRFIFHGVTMDYRGGNILGPSRDVIAEIVESCFYNAETLEVSKIAFPLLGTGAGGFPTDVGLDTMFRVLARILLRRPTCVREVTLVINKVRTR